jgi:hypothetical protein
MSEKQKMDISAKKVTTPEFRVSFPAVFKPKAFEQQEAKYSIVMLFDKRVDLKDLKRAALNAAIEKWGPKEGWPKIRLPFKNGDEKQDLQGYPGTIVVNASSKQRPGVVDKAVQPILDESQFYAGCYARATLIAFAYDKAGNRGIGFALQNIQKLRDGEPFSGRKKAEEEFDAVMDDVSEQPADEASLGF